MFYVPIDVESWRLTVVFDVKEVRWDAIIVDWIHDRNRDVLQSMSYVSVQQNIYYYYY